MEFLQAALLMVAGLAAGSSQGWKASGCVGLGGRRPPAAGAVDGLGAVWLHSKSCHMVAYILASKVSIFWACKLMRHGLDL